MVLKTIEFNEIVRSYGNEEGQLVYEDTRNDIMCKTDKLDLQLYVNYIQLLNGLRTGSAGVNWVQNGYLDLGMMPLAMAPSFMQSAVSNAMANVAKKLGVSIYFMPPVSLLKDKCNIASNDIWVFKEDVANALGKNVEEVCFCNLMRWLGFM